MSSRPRAVLRDLLTGGDRRSIGRVPQVLAIIRRHPGRTRQLVAALRDPDPIVRMRAGDALEKATVARPDLLLPHKRALLDLARRTTEQELRWHLAQLLPRLPLSARQRRGLVRLFREYLEDRSAIVRTFAMQALAELAERDVTLRPIVLPRLRHLSKAGTPAMRARGRMLLRRF